MTSAVFGAVGASTGSLAAGTFGWTASTWSQIGWTAGVLASAYLFRPDGEDTLTVGPRLDDLKITTSTFGRDIPNVFGAYRISGNIIWALPLNEVQNVETEEEDGKGGGGGSSQTSVWYTYDATFAVALCEGPISGIRNIWFDGTLVYEDGSSILYDNIDIYLGNGTQTPNWRIEADKPETPAYRYTAYIVVHSLPLANFGDRIPNVTCEVIKNGTSYSLYDYNSQYSYNIVRNYVPDRIYGYGSGIMPDITLPAGDEFIYFPLVEENFGDDGPLIHLVQTDINLNHIDTRILSYGSTSNLGVVSIICSDNGKFIFGVQSNSSNITIIYTDKGSTGLPSIYVPEPAAYMTNPTAILYSNDKIFLYDSENVATVDPPIYLYNRGSCTAVSCNVLTTWVSSANMAGMKAHKIYCSNNMIFVISDPTYTGATVNTVNVWGTTVPNELLYTFTLPILYISNNQYIVQTYYSDFILYVGSFYGADEFETLYGIDVRTGAVVEQYLLEMPGPNVGSQTSRMRVKNGKLYLYGILHIVTVPLNRISNDGMTVEDACTEISLSCGLDSNDLDYSAGTDELSGYVVSKNMSGRAAIEPMLSAYDFILIENDHKLELKKLQQIADYNIPKEDLGADSDNNIEYNIIQELSLLKLLSIKYANRLSDYQTSIQSSRLIDVNATEEKIVELPLALTDNQAKRLSEKQLYNNWLMRQSYSFQLSFEYNYLVSGDVVTINFDGYIKDVRLVTITFTEDNKVQCKAIANSYDIYNSNAEGSDTGINAGTLVEEIANTRLIMANTPTLSNTYINDEGLYVAAAGYSYNWKGCNVLSKATTIDNLTNKVAIANPSVICTVQEALNDGPTHYWDLVNSIKVNIVSGTISNSTLEGVLNGDNYALVGSEIIQFVNATLVDNTYTLDTLLRGRRGTEHHTDSHVFGETFVLLNTINFFPQTINNNDIYAAISFGKTNIVEYGNFLYNGENLKPFKVSYGYYERTLDTNVDIYWMRRSRYISGSMQTLPLSEETELYSIDIFQLGILKNTYTSTTQTFDYTNTLAVSDGVVLGASIDFEVSQVSGVYGLGYSNTITTTPYDDGTVSTYIKNLLPQVYWRLNESSGSAIDSGINGYTGTVGASVTQGNAAIIPSGDTNYYFTKTSTSNVASTTAGNMNYDTYSYCAFIKLRAGDSGAFLVFKGSTQYELGFYNGVASGTDVNQSLGAYHRQTGVAGVKILGFSGNQFLNTWSHFAATFDGSTLRTYLNGVERTLASVLPVQNAGDNFNINKGLGNANCELSDVCLFSNVLSEEEINNIIEVHGIHSYNANVYFDYLDSLSPINYWILDEGDTTVATDHAGTEDGTHSSILSYNAKLVPGDNSSSRYYHYASGTTYATDLNTSLRFLTTDTYSISMRFVFSRPNNTGYTSNERILVGSWNGSIGFRISVNIAGNVIFRKTKTAISDDLAIATNSSFAPDTVHSLILTYSGTGLSSGVKIYVNGTVQTHTATYDTLTSDITYPNNTYVGCGDGSTTSTRKLRGNVAHLVAFDKVLTATEASDIHDVAIGGDAP